MYNDSLIAAMFKLIPKSIEDQIMLGGEEDQPLGALVNKLSSFANTRQRIKLAKKHPAQPRGGGAKDYDPMDIGGPDC